MLFSDDDFCLENFHSIDRSVCCIFLLNFVNKLYFMCFTNCTIHSCLRINQCLHLGIYVKYLHDECCVTISDIANISAAIGLIKLFYSLDWRALCDINHKNYYAWNLHSYCFSITLFTYMAIFYQLTDLAFKMFKYFSKIVNFVIASRCFVFKH